MSAPAPRQTRPLIDSALDGTLDAASRARLVEQLRTDPVLLASFESERTTLASLKRVTLSRDLTGPILASVEHRRSFLSGSQRLKVWAGRGALAASLLLAAAGVALLQRAYPNAVPWSTRGPVSEVVTTARADATESLRVLTNTMNGLTSQAVGPLAAPERRATQRPQLALGQPGAYEKTLLFRVAAPDAPSASGALSAAEFRAWKLGTAQANDGFVVSRASWSERPVPTRALRNYWDAGAAMQMNEEASAVERSWLLRFWTNSQLDPAPQP